MQGWIKLHRQIMASDLYDEKPFSRLHAWIDLLLLANYEDRSILLGNEMVAVERGSFITSEVKLMERWGWSKTKLRNFLTLLETMQMIEKKADRKKTTITICNYSVYQDLEDHEKTNKKPVEDHKKTNKKPQKDTTKKERSKEVQESKKEEKIIYAEFVSMTETEYGKLVEEFGEENTKRMIEVLNNYKGANGKKYKSDYLAIRNWVVERVMNDAKSGRGSATPATKGQGEWHPSQSRFAGSVKVVSDLQRYDLDD